MPETLEQRENELRNVLRKLEAQTDLSTFSNEEKRLAKECQDYGWFTGIVFEEMISGRIVAEYRYEPRLTREGLSFLAGGEGKESPAEEDKHSRNQFHHVFQLLKGVGAKVWAAIVAIATIVTIAAGWDYISAFVGWLISLFSPR